MVNIAENMALRYEHIKETFNHETCVKCSHYKRHKDMHNEITAHAFFMVGLFLNEMINDATKE